MYAQQWDGNGTDGSPVLTFDADQVVKNLIPLPTEDGRDFPELPQLRDLLLPCDL